MKLSSCEHMLPGASFLERVRFLADNEVEGIELTVGDKGVLLGSLRGRVEEIVAGCSATGVVPSLITTKILDLLDVDPGRRAKAKAEIRDALEVAARIGALGISVVPRFGPPSIPDLSPLGSTSELEHRLFVAEMRELAAEAERLGVVIAIEPLNRYLTKFLRTAAHARQICEEVGSPALEILIDNFQSYPEEVSVADAVRTAGHHIGHVHISDNNRRLPPQGSTDFSPIIGALRSIGYRGFLSFECEVAGDDVAPQFQAALAHMRGLLGKRSAQAAVG
ncbi:MAG: sugar phosphate isomerase/epimerase family protein [Hyphomicrobiales bacterium]